MATSTTAGTNQPANLSATDWMGARVRRASPTMATICASVVPAPTRRASMTKEPLRFFVPPVTSSPAVFSTGMGSPVSMDSSTALSPSSTTPSTGTASCARTRSLSPMPT